MTVINESPHSLAIILCDSVYVDVNGKLILVGTFNQVHGNVLPRASIVFTLSGGRGELDVALAVEHADSGHRIIEMRGPMTLDDPLGVHDFHVELGNVVFPQAGKYWVLLEVEGAILTQRPFEVTFDEAAAQQDQTHG